MDKPSHMWIELIKSITNEAEFFQGVRGFEIWQLEQDLKVEIHNDLKTLLAESNGILGVYGLGLIWPIERIRTDNLLFRTYADFKELYKPFDNLLFFADAGNGDQFAYQIQDGRIIQGTIFCWNHEDDSRDAVASDLKKYLEGWISGDISV
jgi:hypothetical protein